MRSFGIVKKICLLFIIFAGIMIVGKDLFKTSFAYTYEKDNLVLFYKDDYEALSKDIKLYLEDIDDYIISNSSFNYGDRLIDNYDFLVNFAIDVMLSNREYYNEDIIIFVNNVCSFNDKYHLNKETNYYADINKIYEITDKYFNMKDFAIINDNVCMYEDYISLSDYDENTFKLTINGIRIEKVDNYINAIVSYENNNIFIYSFSNDNGILHLVNVEVVL